MHASADASGLAAGRTRCSGLRPYHRPVIPAHRDKASLRLRRLPDRLAAMRAIDVAEAFRDLPGPGPARERAAGSQRALDVPDRRPGRGPRVARRRHRIRSLSRAGSWPGWTGPSSCPRTRRRSSAAWSGSSATTSAHAWERLPAIAVDDQDLPLLRLALHDWVVAWDRRTGSRLARRPGARRRRATAGAAARRRPRPADRWPCRARRRRGGPARTGRDAASRRCRSGRTVASRVRGRRRGRPRAHRARRHLPGQPDPAARDAVRRRPVGAATGASGPAIPSLFSAYLDLGSEPADRPAAGAAVGVARSRSSSVDAAGRVTTRSDQGHATARPDARRGPGARARAARRVPRTGPRT